MPVWLLWWESAAVCIYGGILPRNEHMRESGFLSGEAALDAYWNSALISLVAGRDRPLTANRRGNFFDGGSSFPSNRGCELGDSQRDRHEYPGTTDADSQLWIGGAVSGRARVEAHQHFVSDAVIGSAIGWYLGGKCSGPPSSADIDQQTGERLSATKTAKPSAQPVRLGSNYVPLDSWVYEGH